MKYLCLSLLFFPLCLKAHIVESAHFGEILNHLHTNNTLVITDIDNTLMQSVDHLGSIAWGEHVVSDLIQKGICPDEAQQIENILWRAVHQKIPIRPVDSNTACIVAEIQKRNIPVLGLTARAPRDSEYTRRQLHFLGINLAHITPITDMRHTLALENEALYEEGIIFATNFNKKSHVLLHFLERHNLKPDLVIFIDDKLHHVTDIQEALTLLGIPCIGIRFSGADDQIKAFHPTITDVQWKAFPEYISDDETIELLKQPEDEF